MTKKPPHIMWTAGEETLKFLRERERKGPTLGDAERQELSKKLSRATRNDYRQNFAKILEGIESADVSGDLREAMGATKLLARNKSAPFTQPAKQADGTPLTTAEQTATAWEAFLKEKFRVYEGQLPERYAPNEATFHR